MHPDGKGDVTPLRARVATVAAAALLTRRTGGRAQAQTSREAHAARGFSRRTGPQAARADAITPHEPVLTGIDVLAAEEFASLRGQARRSAHESDRPIARRGDSTIDLLAAAKDVKLVALFSPEHGIRGMLDEQRRLVARREDRPADSIRCTARRGGRPTRCSTASTRS